MKKMKVIVPKEIAYKVVFYKRSSNQLLSSNAEKQGCYLGEYPKEMMLEYKIGQTTVPKIGKIFCFNNKEGANRWRDAMGANEFKVVEGTAESMQVVGFSYVLSSRQWNDTNILDKFWSKPDTITWSFGWEVPSNSYVCDSFTPIKVL